MTNHRASTIDGEDFIASIADALQHISYFHPPRWETWMRSHAHDNDAGVLTDGAASFGAHPGIRQQLTNCMATIVATMIH